MIRFMGGPIMNKRQNLPDSVINHGRYYVDVLPPMSFSRLDSMDPTVSLLQGYYRPSKNPEIWTWVGPNVSDPWKSYERRLKKWQRQMAKLYSEGVYANTVLPPRPTPPVRVP